MHKTFKFPVAVASLALVYAFILLPLKEYYWPTRQTIPPVVSVNLQEEQAIEVIPAESLILASINSLQLEAKRFDIEAFDTRNNWAEHNSAWQWLWGRGISLRGVGYVTASFDLSRVQRSDIVRDGDAYVINIGAPIISHVVLPAENISYMTTPYTGTLVGADEMLRLERYSRMQLERNLRAKACSADIMQQARTHIEQALPEFLSLANGSRVRIRVATSPGAC